EPRERGGGLAALRRGAASRSRPPRRLCQRARGRAPPQRSPPARARHLPQAILVVQDTWQGLSKVPGIFTSMPRARRSGTRDESGLQAREGRSHPLESLRQQRSWAAEVEPHETLAPPPEGDAVAEGDAPGVEEKGKGVVVRYPRLPAVEPGEIGPLGHAHLHAGEPAPHVL